MGFPTDSSNYQSGTTSSTSTAFSTPLTCRDIMMSIILWGCFLQFSMFSMFSQYKQQDLGGGDWSILAILTSLWFLGFSFLHPAFNFHSFFHKPFATQIYLLFLLIYLTFILQASLFTILSFTVVSLNSTSSFTPSTHSSLFILESVSLFKEKLFLQSICIGYEPPSFLNKSRAKIKRYELIKTKLKPEGCVHNTTI